MDVKQIAQQAGITVYEGTQSRAIFAGDIFVCLMRFAELVSQETIKGDNHELSQKT